MCGKQNQFYRGAEEGYTKAGSEKIGIKKKKEEEGKGKRSQNKVGSQKEVMLTLAYFMLIRGVKFLGANLIVTVRISNFFFLLFLLCAQLLNKL